MGETTALVLKSTTTKKAFPTPGFGLFQCILVDFADFIVFIEVFEILEALGTLHVLKSDFQLTKSAIKSRRLHYTTDRSANLVSVKISLSLSQCR